MEMEMQLLSSFYGRKGIHTRRRNDSSSLFSSSNSSVCTFQGSRRRVVSIRSNKNTNNFEDVRLTQGAVAKKGSVVGAIALITGTSIGSGILAIPHKTLPAGVIPTAVTMILCWGFLLLEALLLAEINVSLLSYKERRNKEQVISIRTMAQETLGEWGGTLATVNYVFLGYTTMVAYTSKSGEIINHFSSIPSNISGILFAVLFSFLVSVGGTRTTDQVNQWLTTTMIVLLVAIELVAVSTGEWSGLGAEGSWDKVPSTIPVIIFTLVYHDLTPVICAYLGGDLARIKVSIILGSLVPLAVLLVWNAVALGLSVDADQVVDPVVLLTRLRGGRLSTMVEAFSLLAVGTSLIGTLLGFSQFFLEQFSNQLEFSEKQMPEGDEETSIVKNDTRVSGMGEWWGNNKASIAATAGVVVPPLIISTNVPDVFSTATDIAGGYCMTMLYGVLPPAMAWAMHRRLPDQVGSKRDNEDENYFDHGMLKPVGIFGLGVFACGIVIDQFLQDLAVLHP